MKNLLFQSLITLLFMCHFCALFAQEKNYFEQKEYRNYIADKNIKTVQFFHQGDDLSMPLLLLNSSKKLLLSFDDLKNDPRNFAYKITQCDWDWKPLDNIFTDYLEGMEMNEIYDYYNSENTQVPYTHYRLTIPNEDVRITQTGNYIIQFYDADLADDIVLFQRRFQVIAPVLDISAQVINSNLIRDGGRKQEVNFSFNYEKLNVTDPKNELHVVVTQNARWDLAREVDYTFRDDENLKYQNDKNLFFSPLNEFRAFTIRDEKSVNLHVNNMQYIAPFYHATLEMDGMNRGSVYQTNTDINGAYTITADRTTNPNTQADYIFVHFNLDVPVDLADGIYVFGALTDWDTTKENMMFRVKEHRGYFADILLKEGIYNYAYGYKTAQDKDINLQMFEGDHIETENQYQIWVFYSPIGSRYSQLVGFTSLNSRK
ncbi:DUF5103 domain-containing protein [Halosquirtibacter xylanolyticus]|uniref:type IX secretion system plug protein n=1 Tax=Halosquirtibacter xylanolyticus TaxID=3374599 RepID=UPI00374A5CAD|nr:DUF5103 domain-containing protein [Prolixibacteraceae bacterium]